MRVGVVGLGYVGAVTAACYAKIGHVVYGFERDRAKLQKLRAGIAPFSEPDLNVLLSAAVNAKRLFVSSEIGHGLTDLDILLICVGTPSTSDGAHSTAQLENICESVASVLKVQVRYKPLTIAIRSTVTPGTTEDLRTRFFDGIADVNFAHIPEFLREGTAVKDFFEPALIVIGAQDDVAVRAAFGLFDGIDAPKHLLSIRAAEMVKGVCNGYHALKAAFANETGSLAAACGVDAEELMAVFCRDTQLNISSAYLKPGFAFGGSCLPKDVRAINYVAQKKGLLLPLYYSILPSNEEHLRRAAARVIAAGFKRAGFLGLSFKAHTDDVRESPAIRLAATLKATGIEVWAFDPDIRADMLHGANLNALKDVFISVKSALAPTLEDLLNWADGLVLTKQAPADMAGIVRSCAQPVIDVSRLTPPGEDQAVYTAGDPQC